MDMQKEKGSVQGAVYGDIIGAPYMIENTYNRYFDLGETRRAYSHGRVRTFFPEVTEVSHATAAVLGWLVRERESPTPEGLQKALREQFGRHPRGGWTGTTRLFLSDDGTGVSSTPDWSAVARVAPVACFYRDDLARALEASEACVRATCGNAEAVRMGQAVTNCIWSALNGSTTPELFTMLEMQYGLRMTVPDDDLRAELRGEEKVPLEMLGKEVPGAYRYVLPEHPKAPSATLVTEAAMKAVTGSDSWEDAVRRAVSYGGPSNAVAGIAGALAEAVYGEVTPSIIGKLFTHIPIGMEEQLESFHRASRSERAAASVRTEPRGDALTIVGLGPGNTVYVVPEDRDDILKVINDNIPSARIITPDGFSSLLKGFEDSREGTYAYGVRPEVRTLYVQNGKLVSPSMYTGPGMPSLRERKQHLDEFMKFKAWCIEQQRDMNARAGNEGAGQIHYQDAYHMWIGSRRVDFFYGSSPAGSVFLNQKGLLNVELGEMRSIGADSRFENHHEQAWISRGIFSMEDTVSPLTRLQQMREEIAYTLLDEGVGCENHELDSRYASKEDLDGRLSVSNVDRLTQLDPGECRGVGAEPAFIPADSRTKDGESRGKENTIFSIGYGVRTQDAFINTLRMSGIDTVIDVRSIPRSKYVPQFDEDVICEALLDNGISYFSGGEKLGGRFADRSLLDGEGRVDWEKVRDYAPFRKGIEAVTGMADGGHSVAIVCAEGDPLSCHRFGLVSRALAAEGYEMKHIMTNGEVIGQVELEDRLLEKYTSRQMIPGIFNVPYSEQVDEAFRAMNREHGYRPLRRRAGYSRHF